MTQKKLSIKTVINNMATFLMYFLQNFCKHNTLQGDRMDFTLQIEISLKKVKIRRRAFNQCCSHS